MEINSFLAYSLGVVGFAILGVILFLVGMAVWGSIGDWKKHSARKKQRKEKVAENMIFRRTFFGIVGGFVAALFGWPFVSWAKTKPLKEIIDSGEYRGAPWTIYYNHNKHKTVCWETKFSPELPLKGNIRILRGYGQEIALRDDFDCIKEKKTLVKFVKVFIKRSVDMAYDGKFWVQERT